MADPHPLILREIGLNKDAAEKQCTWHDQKMGSTTSLQAGTSIDFEMYIKAFLGFPLSNKASFNLIIYISLKYLKNILFMRPSRYRFKQTNLQHQKKSTTVLARPVDRPGWAVTEADSETLALNRGSPGRLKSKT